MEIGVIGGGMMGLATAFYLSREGIPVTIIEKEKEVGGLSRSDKIMKGLCWDRFYHVILSTDSDLLKFINDIGLSYDVQFKETQTGFYTDGQLHSVSNTIEFLKFKPLSFWDKIRLAIGILYSARVKNWSRLEKIYVRTWLIRVFGRRNYEKMWDPLLGSKLGTAKNQVSAAFIWATIKRLYGTRHSSTKKEMMGCVRGGYHSILQHVQDHLKKNGATILLNRTVKKIEENENGRLLVKCHNGQDFEFDKIVLTVPNPEILNICSNLPKDFQLRLEAIKYLSLICATLVLKRSLSPFYTTNLTDSGFPFTGLIEATNVIPSEVLGGSALVYLPRYMSFDDPFYNKSDKQVMSIFLNALQRIFPDLTDEEIITYKVHRERYVQPILEIGYSEKIPSMITPVKNLHIVNTTMILNSPLNNNQVIQLANRMAKVILGEDNNKQN
jgi:protoporphyrinogen oxidase